MNELKISNFNFKWTLLGGQSFGWDYDPKTNTYTGFTQHSVIKIIPENEKILWQTYPKKDNYDFIAKYLRLDFDYDNLLKKISKDEYIKTAIEKYPDLRVLGQDLDETLLSFVISANNNIKSIRKSIRMMNKKFGEKIIVDNNIIYLFPKTEVLADADINDLLDCKLGFHAKFLKGVAQSLVETELGRKVYKMSESEVRGALMNLNGVGNKIADCVLIYSLGFDNVTPLDVWGKRICVDLYKCDPKMRYEDMRNWIDKYFNGYAGWAGQFLFEYIRNL